MNNPKHTPGPNAVSYAGPNQPIHVYNRESGRVLAEVKSLGDANVFAAAPDLLEALNTAIYYFDQNGGEESYSWLSELKDARDKARGGAE